MQQELKHPSYDLISGRKSRELLRQMQGLCLFRMNVSPA